MSKFDEAIELYKTEMEKLNIAIDGDLLHGITKSLGPSIYSEDANKVSCSDPEELARVKKNFLIKKLGLADSSDLDDEVKAVCTQMGSANRRKFRAIFYYLLVQQHEDKRSLFV